MIYEKRLRTRLFGYVVFLVLTGFVFFVVKGIIDTYSGGEDIISFKTGIAVVIIAYYLHQCINFYPKQVSKVEITGNTIKLHRLYFNNITISKVDSMKIKKGALFISHKGKKYEILYDSFNDHRNMLMELEVVTGLKIKE